MSSLVAAGESGDTVLFSDPSCGFSFAVPGHPALTDAGIEVADLNAALGYRLVEGPLIANRPDIIAAAYAQAHVKDRSSRPMQVQPTDSGYMPAWGGSALCTVLYPLRAAEDGYDIEELVIALRSAEGKAGGWAVYLSARFSSGRTNPVDLASFTSAVNCSMRWEPGAPARAVPQLFPDSDILEPGLPLRLKPKWIERIAPTTAELARVVKPGEAAGLFGRLGMLAGGPEAPTTVVDDARQRAYRGVIHSLARSGVIAEHLLSQFEVATVHDVRGWVMFVMKVILGLP
jgi:hypothetical protein